MQKLMGHTRRQALMRIAAITGATAGIDLSAHAQQDGDAQYPPVSPGLNLRFPRDHGAHPDYRIEWWYLTAWLQTPGGPAGLHLTFFRTRTEHGRRNPSRLAPRQFLFAHAALSLPDNKRLLQHQLAARAGAVTAMFSTADTQVSMGTAAKPWLLRRNADDSYLAELTDEDFGFSLRLMPPGPPVLQGERGLSRKGPKPAQASYYYSRPNTGIQGTLRVANRSGGQAMPVNGTGWIDHEWSSELLDKNAVGWDWVGLHLDNGDALMAFRIRNTQRGVLWSHARRIRNNTPMQTPAPMFTPRRVWQSPRTGTDYPVEMVLQVGDFRARLVPMIDDQELDTRASTGILYWEGAVRVIDTATGKQIGRGYLELTGYDGKISL